MGASMRAGDVHNDAFQEKATAYYTPTSNTTVYLRALTVVGTYNTQITSSTPNWSSTWATIQQIGSSAIVNPWILSGTNTYNTTGNVGIGTNAPDASAILDLTSSTQGISIPGMTSTQRTAIASPKTGLQVYDQTTKSIWFYDGTSWNNSVTIASYGDIKTGIQSSDHNGWIKLDGRLKSTLTTTQQAQATTLGIGTNLPNASNSFLSQNGTTLGSVTGSNSKTITQANLPNINFSTATTSSNGDHSHWISGATYDDNNFSGHGVNTQDWGLYADAGGYSANDPNHSYGRYSLNAGSHSHTVTVSSGGSGSLLDITPQSLSVNIFIYLGN